jgi:hypothetical protein
MPAIATKTEDYAIALTYKTPAHCGRTGLHALVQEFIKNRTYNLAFTALLEEAFDTPPAQVRRKQRRKLLAAGPPQQDTFWFFVGVGQQKDECLQIMKMCISAVRDHGDNLIHEMDMYNSCHRP